MTPKVRISRDQIISAAIEIVRADGESALNARTIAARLGCSTQPLFSNFASMDELHQAVIAAAVALYSEYITREVASGQYPPYKASGMAYIRFAREEKELFKLLYMRSRSKESDSPESGLFGEMMGLVQENTGVDAERAKLFHLEMWAYVHGIAAMIATGYLELEWELISRMLTDAYQSMKKHYEQEDA